MFGRCLMPRVSLPPSLPAMPSPLSHPSFSLPLPPLASLPTASFSRIHGRRIVAEGRIAGTSSSIYAHYLHYSWLKRVGVFRRENGRSFRFTVAAFKPESFGALAAAVVPQAAQQVALELLERLGIRIDVKSGNSPRVFVEEDDYYSSPVNLTQEQWESHLTDEAACRGRLFDELWEREAEVKALKARLAAAEQQQQQAERDLTAQSASLLQTLEDATKDARGKEAAMAAALQEMRQQMAVMEEGQRKRDNEVAELMAALKESEQEEKDARGKEAAMAAALQEMRQQMAVIEEGQRKRDNEVAELMAALKESEQEEEKLEEVLEALIADSKAEREYVKVLEKDLVEVKAEMLAKEAQRKTEAAKGQGRLGALAKQLEETSKGLSARLVQMRVLLGAVERLGDGDAFKTKCTELGWELAEVQAAIVKCERVLDEAVEAATPSGRK